MEALLTAIEGSNPELKDASLSFYRFGDQLLEKSKLHGDATRRFLALMRSMNARSFCQEHLEETGELTYERISAQNRCGGSVTLHAQRLTFFSSFPTQENAWLDRSLMPDSDILGYAILITLTLPNFESRAYILEAVAREPGGATLNEVEVGYSLRHYFVHCARTHQTFVGSKTNGRPFSIRGSFFSEQNDLTHVCAHSALRIAINSTSFCSEIKLTHEYINTELNLNLNSIGHYFPEDSHVNGLTTLHLERIVRSLNCNSILVDFRTFTRVEYDHYTYPFMESGCPVILGLDGIDVNKGRFIRHAVTVLGHTLNADRWAPQARSGYGMMPILKYIPAAEWADHFVISDDGYGAYQTLQTDVVRNLLVPSKNTSLHAVFAMGIVPSFVKFGGLEAEELAQTVVQKFSKQISADNYWIGRLKDSKPVLRTLLQSRRRYISHIEKALSPETINYRHRQSLEALPENFWVSEISLSNLYSTNRKKIGDVVICAASQPRNHEEAQKSVLLIWLTGACIIEPQKPQIDLAWQITEPISLLSQVDLET